MYLLALRFHNYKNATLEDSTVFVFESSGKC